VAAYIIQVLFRCVWWAGREYDFTYLAEYTASTSTHAPFNQTPARKWSDERPQRHTRKRKETDAAILYSISNDVHSFI